MRRLQKLNHTHHAYILFKIGGRSNQEIADVLGVSMATLRMWGKDDLIREERGRLEETIGDGARKYLESLLPEAIHTMADIMRNKRISERTRLDAASRIMDKALPQESIQTVRGDPNAPILYEMLQTEDDQAAMKQIQDLTPEQKAEYAEAVEKLERFANAASGSE